MTTDPACAECGFVYDLTKCRQAGAAIVAGVDRLAEIVESTPNGIKRRPDPTTWSIHEYGCHVRDVLLVQRERLLAARRVDRPDFGLMGRDERVEHDGYADQDPLAVARQMRDAAALFAGVLSRFDDDTWERTAIYNYPRPTERTLAWVALHTQHEVQHHRHDIDVQRLGV
ncbi:MAG TPA: DinB family protein [Ilumatobacteraceae bacterium]